VNTALNKKKPDSNERNRLFPGERREEIKHFYYCIHRAILTNSKHARYYPALTAFSLFQSTEETI